MKFSSPAKIAILVIIFAGTFLYAKFKKDSLSRYNQIDNFFILKTMPNFQVEDIYTNQQLQSLSLISNKVNAIYVHFCGTWCAPCLEELPALIEYAKSNVNKPISFILLASQDEVVKIKKFLKKFRPLPKNIFVVLDNTGQIMANFGTVKVPETYLFGKNYQLLYRFIAQQDWSNKLFRSKIDELIVLNN